MIEIQYLRDHPEEIIKRLEKRNLPHAAEEIARALAFDSEKRKALAAMDNLRNELNLVSKSIGVLLSEGKKEEAELAKATTSKLKEDIHFFEESHDKIDKELVSILLSLPNPPHNSVPKGRTPEDNEVVFSWGEIPRLPEGAKPHWELCGDHDIVDFQLGVKLTGAGFPVYKGKGAKLQRALISFFLEEAGKAGYTEIQPPLMVNEDSAYGTGQLPDKEGQMYHVSIDDLYLIPTAEVPITNIFRDVILKEEEFPVKLCGYTPCFRREAGSYGKDVRGLNRLHQFDKVEIVRVAAPENSYEILDEMLAHVKGLLEKLELPYRVLLLCGGDMGFASAKTFDLEVFSTAQEKWLEVSSVSNFETFQSNRLKLRFKDSGKKNRLAHTLNGSALALPRIFASLLENNQQADGSILIPKALQPYTGFDRIG